MKNHKLILSEHSAVVENKRAVEKKAHLGLQTIEIPAKDCWTYSAGPPE